MLGRLTPSQPAAKLRRCFFRPVSFGVTSQETIAVMLSESRNAEFYPEWLEYITEDGAKAAFVYLAGYASTLRKMNCHARFKGEIRDFQFHDASGETPFSFTINRRWLLFYFRLPSLRSGKYSRDVLEQLLPHMRETAAGEWTIRISNVDDAKRLTMFLVLT